MLRKFLTLSVYVILLAVMVKPVISAQIVSPGDLLNKSVDRIELSAKVDIGKKLWQIKSSVVQQQRLNGRSAPDSLHAIILICDFQDYKFYGQWDEMDQDLLLNPYGDFYLLLMTLYTMKTNLLMLRHILMKSVEINLLWIMMSAGL